jgi:hypothetical protein
VRLLVQVATCWSAGRLTPASLARAAQSAVGSPRSPSAPGRTGRHQAGRR